MLDKLVLAVAAIIAAALALAEPGPGAGGYPGPEVVVQSPAPVVETPAPSPPPSATPINLYECIYYIPAPAGGLTCGGWLYWGGGTPIPPTFTPSGTAYP